jgi:hemolysin activation/secretion protein
MYLEPFTIAQAIQSPNQALVANTSPGSGVNVPTTQDCSDKDNASLTVASLSPPLPHIKVFRIDASSSISKVVEKYLARVDRDFARAHPLEIAECATQIYLRSGYVLSGVPLSSVRAAALDKGDIPIPIKLIEASLSKQIAFNPPTPAPEALSQNIVSPPVPDPLFEKYLSDRIQLNLSKPLNWNTLEDNLTLLKNDPLIKAETFRADLFKEGESYPRELLSETAKLKVYYKPTSRFYTGFSSDNYLSSSIGSNRATSLMGFRNLVGIGDNLALSYSRSSTGGAQSYDISYQRILNPLNGTLQFRVAPNSYRITEAPYKSLGIRGTSTLYEVNLRQPIIRSLRKELAFSLGFSAQTGQSFFSKTIPLSNTDTKTLKFGQDYRIQNSSGGWQLGSQFNFGFQTNQNKSSFSWQGQLERQQKITDNYSISAQLNLQLTPQNLATSQEFFLGGAQSLRGYRTNALSGDNGLRFALENRISLAKNNTFVAVPFLDLGYAWNQPTSAKAAPSSNQKFLASAGLGLIWQPSRNMGLRLDYGIPLSQGSVNGINLRDPSLYFSVNYRP